VTEKPDNLLGRVLDEMASRRGVRGPYSVADHVRQETGKGPSGSAWSQIFSGETRRPRQDAMIAFIKAFKLSPEELQRLAHVFTYNTEPPEDMELYPKYVELAAQLVGAESQEGDLAEGREETSMSEGTMPTNWIGERVRVAMQTDEEVQGTLKGVTEHGIVVYVRGRRQEGPCYYSWKDVRWMYPIDRQTTR